VQLGGVPLQFALQLESQVSLQEAMHCVSSPPSAVSDVQSAEQCPLQSVSHDPSQLKLPVVHPPVQLATHAVVQLTSAVKLQPPLQLVSRSAEHWS
jgi:hypothetical protein